jgi:predicted  nucleic acid-binding Zn-ribbon protein
MLLKKYAPHLLKDQKAEETLETEIADLKKKIKKLKDKNIQLRKAKIELERKLVCRGG